jgi:CRP-like cAMP-binding protein
MRFLRRQAAAKVSAAERSLFVIRAWLSDMSEEAKVNIYSNTLLARLSPVEIDLISPHLEQVALPRGRSLFEPGDDVEYCYFPAKGCLLSLVIALPEGKIVEAAHVGFEGALGGIISAGNKPAFARAVVQIAGVGFKLPIDTLDRLKQQSAHISDLFARYADAVLAQVLQSVACAAVHSLEARCCRWLLVARSRSGVDNLPVTHEFLAEMLGVQRTYVTAIVRNLQKRGIIKLQRGQISILDPVALRQSACACNDEIERHFAEVLPKILV